MKSIIRNRVGEPHLLTDTKRIILRYWIKLNRERALARTLTSVIITKTMIIQMKGMEYMSEVKQLRILKNKSESETSLDNPRKGKIKVKGVSKGKN